MRRRSTTEEGVEVDFAEMQVGFKAGLRALHQPRHLRSEQARVSLVEYVDGPFKKLENRWTFADEMAGPDGAPRSVVDFFINYEFRSRTLGLVMGTMFDSAFHKYSDAFVKRADEVYGRR